MRSSENFGSGLRSLLGGLALLTVAGCAADTGSSDTSTASTASTTAGPTVDESARVHSFLDAQYTRADVRHEFTNRKGQAIDCVDFVAEPGVKHLLARGLTLEEIRGDGALPEQALEYNKTAKLNDWYLAGDPDEQGRARACPEGTTPHVRITEADIAKAGGLDAFLRRGRKVSPPTAVGAPGAPPPGGPQYQDYQWVMTGWYDSNAVNNTGGISTMTIAQPTIPTNVEDHSLEQLWLIGGSGSSEQTVEAGWTVADGVNEGDTAPHVFIYSTAAGYSELASCYNGNLNGGCPDWIPSSKAIYPMLSLASDVSTQGGSPQHELTVDVERRLGTVTVDRVRHVVADGWQVLMSIDGGPMVQLGYFPFSDYGSGPLATGWANEFEVGAEVEDTTGTFTEFSPNVQMGEGSLGWNILLPNAPTGNAAYQRNFAYYSGVEGFGSSWTPVSTGAQTAANIVGLASATSTTCTANCVYDAFPSSSAAAESSTWTNWFYFADATPALAPVRHL